MTEARLRFPLVERAEKMGVLDGQSALVVAPTATGKSHIGRETVCRAIGRKAPGTHAYLVPFRALAEELFDAFSEALRGTGARLRIVTGDHRDAVKPEESNLVVATYESFAGIVRRPEFLPGVVVADEIHLIADEERGPIVEGLFARLLAANRLRSLCALSAVVQNGEDLASWLGVPLLQGTVDDRPVPLKLECRIVSDTEEALRDALRPCGDGEQALVFCSSRPRAEKAALRLAERIGEGLAPEQREALAELVRGLGDDEEGGIEKVVALLPSGVGFHHAGLPKAARKGIERAFRNRLLRVLACTPTLAAGVNLPAGIAVVRDIFRSDTVRGKVRQVVLAGGEVLNMLGRAARPLQVSPGVGIALIEKPNENDPRVKRLIDSIRSGHGGSVVSSLLDSFEGIMRFVLSVVVEKGEATRQDVANAFLKTLAHHARPRPVSFDRPFKEDMMEDLPEYRRVLEAKGAIRLKSYDLSPEGVRAIIDSSGKRYIVLIGVTGVTCDCPAASQFYRGRTCKHQACAIHDLLFAPRIEGEARARTIYNCVHVFARTLDPGTLLGEGLEILDKWRLIERVPAGWKATPVGEVASTTGFDLLLVHQAVERVRGARSGDYRAIARWAVEDFFADEEDRSRWSQAMENWLDEVDVKEIRLPVKYRGDFERRLEDLSRVCLLYEKSAGALSRSAIAQAARAAAGAIRYGVSPELVPLMALSFPQLARARSRFLYQNGIRNVEDLAGAIPSRVADPRRAPETLIETWVQRAREIVEARNARLMGPVQADAAFDELIARFRLDPAALSLGAT